jgi:predicted short-subunit dehydrogenase-like oxidoreductase (DUF2520 family)
LSARGHEIASVAGSRAAETKAKDLGGHARAIEEVGRGCDLLVVAVPDDALEEVVAGVAPSLSPDTWVIHTCGRVGGSVLSALGERVAAVHPAIPVATEASLFTGAPFGVTCSDDMWGFASWLVGELGGVPVRIEEERRVLYHAALCLASNFTAALAADAIELTDKALIVPLLRATLDNIERLPPSDALTGPVVRGDAGTVTAHLAALDDDLRDVYVANSLRVLSRVADAGMLDGARVERLRHMLEGAR